MTPWSLYTLVQLNWIENSILIFIKLNESIEKQQEIKKNEEKNNPMQSWFVKDQNWSNKPNFPRHNCIITISKSKQKYLNFDLNSVSFKNWVFMVVIKLTLNF